MTRPLANIRVLELGRMFSAPWAGQLFADLNVTKALVQGTFDGLVSTNMSLVAAKLWEAGVRYGFEDHQFCGAYIPMMSGTFWAKLPADLQKMVTEIWAANIPTYSANVLQAQREARAIMETNGVKFHDPTPEAAAALRAAMMARGSSVPTMKMAA